MSALMEDESKRWTARRRAALVLEIIQGKTTVAEASRAHDLPPSEIEEWVASLYTRSAKTVVFYGMSVLWILRIIRLGVAPDDWR